MLAVVSGSVCSYADHFTYCCGPWIIRDPNGPYTVSGILDQVKVTRTHAILRTVVAMIPRSSKTIRLKTIRESLSRGNWAL